LRVQYGVCPSAERGRCGSSKSAPDVHWSAPGVHHSDNTLHICNVVALLSLVFLPCPHLCLLSVSFYCFQQSICVFSLFLFTVSSSPFVSSLCFFLLFPAVHLCLLSVSFYCFQQSICVFSLFLFTVSSSPFVSSLCFFLLFPAVHLCLLSVSFYCFQQSILCIDCLQIDIIICRL